MSRPVGAPMRVLVLQGPNLNLLGRREPAIYGTTTLAEIAHELDVLAEELKVELTHRQSNQEGVLIDSIHEAMDSADGILVNPAGYGHTSVALLDALVGAGLPFVEVHLSNVHAREDFRRRSLLSAAAVGVIAGFGSLSYALGLRGLVSHLRRGSHP